VDASLALGAPRQTRRDTADGYVRRALVRPTVLRRSPPAHDPGAPVCRSFTAYRGGLYGGSVTWHASLGRWVRFAFGDWRTREAAAGDMQRALLDLIRAGWPIFLGVWVIGVLLHVAWNGRGFLEQRRRELRQGEWPIAIGITALGLASMLWWSAVGLVLLLLLVAAILWLVYESGLGG
jgi:hypothetical protein